MEKLLHGQTKSSRNFIWKERSSPLALCTEVLEYFENGSIKEYKNGNIKINKRKYKNKNGNIYENGHMKCKYLMNI